MIPFSMDTTVADANLRAMHPGDIWVATIAGEVHAIGRIKPGNSYCVCGNTPPICRRAGLLFSGHARPGRPTCQPCTIATIEIPPNVLAAAREDRRLHLVRAKDADIRRAILVAGDVVGFCHPHDTARGFRLGPLFVLPSHRGRGLIRAAYEQHAAGRRCIAYIHDWNEPSARAHAGAGFVKSRRDRGGWIWVREAVS